MALNTDWNICFFHIQNLGITLVNYCVFLRRKKISSVYFTVFHKPPKYLLIQSSVQIRAGCKHKRWQTAEDVELQKQIYQSLELVPINWNTFFITLQFSNLLIMFVSFWVTHNSDALPLKDKSWSFFTNLFASGLKSYRRHEIFHHLTIKSKVTVWNIYSKIIKGILWCMLQ